MKHHRDRRENTVRGWGSWRRGVADALTVGVLFFTAACGGGTAAADEDADVVWNPRGHGDAAWRLDAIWDDGNAEFCVYEATWARYDHHYPGRVALITVKEPWNPELDVKADTPHSDGFEVLKLNYVRDVPTGIYTYHQTASTFLRRRRGTLRKLATSSSEMCGISTGFLVDGELVTRSYFDRQGERRQLFPPGVLPADSLPLLLREYVAGEIPKTLLVFPSLLQGHFPPLAPVRYELRRSRLEEFDAPVGSVPAIRLDLRGEERELGFVFAARRPHRLLRFETSEGTEYRVAKCERIPYWEMHDPGGEAWLPDRLQSP